MLMSLDSQINSCKIAVTYYVIYVILISYDSVEGGQNFSAQTLRGGKLSARLVAVNNDRSLIGCLNSWFGFPEIFTANIRLLALYSMDDKPYSACYELEIGSHLSFFFSCDMQDWLCLTCQNCYFHWKSVNFSSFIFLSSDISWPTIHSCASKGY